METRIEFKSLELQPKKYGFNWAHLLLGITDPKTNDGIFSAKVMLRVPNNLSSIEEIQKHALDSAKKYLKHCVSALYDE